MAKTLNIISLFVKSILSIVIIIFWIIILYPNRAPINNKTSIKTFVSSYDIKVEDIIYSLKQELAAPALEVAIVQNIESREDKILKIATAMAEIKWTPIYDLLDKKASFTFKKGVTYTGIPYSMDGYQVSTAQDFQVKIKSSKIIYGNDCSGFVSAAWGIKRQTTLGFYNALKNKTLLEGKFLTQLSWNDLKLGDALLLDNGKGIGHIMLFVSFDNNNKDNINVYEQNISTKIPYEPIPVVREDVRSINNLKASGYIPIRLG
ncbi:MAG TPA: hypothetical protein VIK72_01510 [Clostridiaceae bacterium]